MRTQTLDTFPPELDALAAESSEASFYQTGTWLESVRASFPALSFRCIVAEDGGEVAGYLPFFYLRRGLFRSAWSLPFGTYGGPVTRVGSDARASLVSAYRELSGGLRVLNAGWVDFFNAAGPEEGTISHAEAHVVDLSDGFEAVFAERYSRKRRQLARRAEREGVEIRRATTLDEVRETYALCADKMRRLERHLQHPPELFDQLMQRGGDAVRLFIATRGGENLGGHFDFYFRDMAIAWFGMLTDEGDDLDAGTLLLTRCMEGAAAEGFTRFNLGGSLGKDKLMGFKESLGARPYRYQLVRNDSRLAVLAGKLRGRR